LLSGVIDTSGTPAADVYGVFTSVPVKKLLLVSDVIVDDGEYASITLVSAVKSAGLNA
jgi:hypothetical protein